MAYWGTRWQPLVSLDAFRNLREKIVKTDHSVAL